LDIDNDTRIFRQIDYFNKHYFPSEEILKILNLKEPIRIKDPENKIKEEL